MVQKLQHSMYFYKLNICTTLNLNVENYNNWWQILYLFFETHFNLLKKSADNTKPFSPIFPVVPHWPQRTHLCWLHYGPWIHCVQIHSGKKTGYRPDRQSGSSRRPRIGLCWRCSVCRDVWLYAGRCRRRQPEMEDGNKIVIGFWVCFNEFFTHCATLPSTWISPTWR